MISGFLTNETPLRKAFPSGIVPLMRPNTIQAKCEAVVIGCMAGIIRSEVTT